MIWASERSGGGGAELIPGEVRMFVGDVPAGWASVTKSTQQLQLMSWALGPANAARDDRGYGCQLSDGRFLFANYSAAALFQLFDPATDAWVDKAAHPSVSVSLSRMAPVGSGNALVVGGASTSNATNAVYLFDSAANTFTAKTSYPLSIRDNSLVALSATQVLSIGGTVSGTATYSDDCYVYDAEANTWTQKADLPIAAANGSATLLADGRVLYAGGKTTGGTAINGAYIWDPVADTWSTVAVLPAARYGHDTFYDSVTNTVYVYGGLCSSFADRNNMLAYDVTIDSYSVVDASPYSLLGGTVACGGRDANGRALAFGAVSFSASDKVAVYCQQSQTYFQNEIFYARYSGA